MVKSQKVVALQYCKKTLAKNMMISRTNYIIQFNVISALSSNQSMLDHNIGKFAATNEEIQDHVWAITPSIAFRPAGMTVLRLNYTYQLTKDIVGNGPSKMGSIKFGISSYF